MPRFPHCVSSAAALAAFALAAACRDEPARPPATGAPPATAAPSSARPASLPATFEARAASSALVHDSAPQISGPLPKEAIRQVINRNVAQFMTCFQLAPADSPARGGKVTIHFTINPGGNVVDATIAESTVGKSPVATCVLETVQSLKFAPPLGGGTVEVTYPFVFRPAR